MVASLKIAAIALILSTSPFFRSAPLRCQNGSFAGWIKSGSCGITIRRKDRDLPKIPINKLAAVRVYVGDHVKPESASKPVNYVLYGMEFSEPGDFTIPERPRSADRGRLALNRWFVIGGGKAPDWQLPPIDQLTDPILAYHVMNVVELPESPYRNLKLGLSLVTGKRKPIVPASSSHPDAEHIERDTQCTLVVSNPNSVPIYVSVLDVRSDPLSVKVVYPIIFSGAQALPAHFSGPIQAILPIQGSRGVEEFRVIASTQPINLKILETSPEVLHEESIGYRPDLAASDDALMAVIGEISANPALKPLGQWISEKIDVAVD